MTLIEMNDWNDGYYNTINVKAFTRRKNSGEQDVIYEINYANQFDTFDLVSSISQTVGDIEGQDIYVYKIVIEGRVD